MLTVCQAPVQLLYKSNSFHPHNNPIWSSLLSSLLYSKDSSTRMRNWLKFKQLSKRWGWDQLQAVWIQGMSSLYFYPLFVTCLLLSSKLQEGTDSSI